MVAALVVALAHSARADFSIDFNSGFQDGGAIADGSLIGWSDTRLLAVPFNTISDVNVRLNISGGWNGDLYAYLVHSSGFTVLLNRVGATTGDSFGYSDGGLNVTFDTQANQSQDIHFYGSVAGFDIQNGTAWRPDGRNIDPNSDGAAFDSTTPSALLTSFNGINPNGSWTLFLADLVSGDAHAVTSWGLQINGFDTTPVPEPRSFIEGSLAALLIGALLSFYRLKGFRAVFGAS